MSSCLTDKVYAFTRRKALFSTPCHLLIGVSGGADSMALLHCLVHWPDKGLRLSVAHLHHGLRGAEADRDAAFVQQYCEAHQIPVYVKQVDVVAEAKKQHVSVETAGRQLRYAYFEQIRADVGADYIITAHNADDQSETVLMHLLRGCGIDGLCGIPAVRERIRRPLLCCTRAEIEAYCLENGIDYVTDGTNADMQYTRNRIRHQLLPALREVNPSVDEALTRLAAHAAEDADYLRQKATEALEAAETDKGWAVSAFTEQPIPIRRRMITLLLKDLHLPNREETHILAIEQALNSGVGEVSLPNTWVCFVSQGQMRFLPRDWGEDVPAEIAVTTLPFSEQFGAHPFTLSLVSADEGQNVHNLFVNAVVDYATIRGKLYVRSRREGDYFHPAGRNVGKSLKKLMNEWQIPACDRGHVPLLCDEEGVVLVPGYGCDERVKPTENTKHFLVWDATAEQG